MDDLNISYQEEAMKRDIKMVWSQNKKKKWLDSRRV